MPRTAGLPANLSAFLDMLAASEGTTEIPGGDDGYAVLVGSTPIHPRLFETYFEHPHQMNHALHSTASGRYQIIYPTWQILQIRLRLPDFGPESQDAAAIELLKDRYAYHLILCGHFKDAVFYCAPEWASLPGSKAGQHTHSLEWLQAAYVAAGGSVA